ncbi:hypothetical protein ONZ45_g6092 [Pleurotus djamor]|nr:hypothetical protein ONZ45_g6092 [Pleurotus djamor]
MAMGLPLLSSTTPTALAVAPVHIGHVQLRDLIICPRESGVVNYVQQQAIVEHNLRAPDTPPRIVSNLSFTPNTISSLPLQDGDSTLIAAGGQEAEIHISVHRKKRPIWHLSRSNESSVEPRAGISNNDCSVRFYDLPIRGHSQPKELKEAGLLRLTVPVNHSSISPDGRTLLSVGDSPKVYLHHITGGARITFAPIHTLTLPPPDSYPLNYSSSLAASFSTAFSADGSKFAVASQEGLVAVWDVRSSKPLKVFQTDKSRMPPSTGNGAASGWLSDDPWDWTRGHSKAPGWSVRSVKFGCGGHGLGKELMVFTEHTSLVHVVDARTFEAEEVIQMPTPRSASIPTPMPRPATPVHVPRSRSPAPLPRPPMIVLALEDTFRISSSHNPNDSNRRWDGRSAESSGHHDDDVVVIPPLGDREMEHDVQALLGQHGIRARQFADDAEPEMTTSYAPYRGPTDEDMEVDELESDCLSSHTPSRSSSPSPSTHIPTQASPARHTLSPPQNSGTPARRSRHRLHTHQQTQSDYQRGNRSRTPNPYELFEHEDRDYGLDLAGICFDPSGEHFYVASSNGVAEWSVRGAEKRWWVDKNWI